MQEIGNDDDNGDDDDDEERENILVKISFSFRVIGTTRGRAESKETKNRMYDAR